jgi:Fe-S-cluster containining protein
MLDHSNPILFKQGWKHCYSCGWSCDKEGYNLVDKKEENLNEKDLFKESSGIHLKKDENYEG